MEFEHYRRDCAQACRGSITRHDLGVHGAGSAQVPVGSCRTVGAMQLGA